MRLRCLYWSLSSFECNTGCGSKDQRVVWCSRRWASPWVLLVLNHCRCEAACVSSYLFLHTPGWTSLAFKASFGGLYEWLHAHLDFTLEMLMCLKYEHLFSLSCMNILLKVICSRNAESWIVISNIPFLYFCSNAFRHSCEKWFKYSVERN